MQSQTNVALRSCRLIYYGPSGTGKRDNLLHIASSIPQEHRIVVPGADAEREIAFLLKSGQQGDWRISVQAVDTDNEGFEGESGGEAPFDGIVFVAHSAPSWLDQTLSSLESMKAFLGRWDRDVTSVPIVLQYNHRASEGCLSVDRLESLLNPWGLLSFPANADRGEGTRETLKAVLSLTVSHLIRGEEGDETLPAEQKVVEQAVSPNAASAPEIEAVTGAPAGNAGNGAESDQLRSGNTFGQEQLNVMSEDRGGIFFDDLRPPIVVPVRIPAKLLEKYGSVRIILEVEVDDSDSMLV